jgi:AcrR family transcriptional regulator/DNA/RNA-binding domain of Phe-tRNA-synthetase-like protein
MARALPVEGRLQRRKARTVAAILDAAERHFLTRGYEAARVDEIAADADVAVGSIYNHFGSKEGLYAELLERALARFEAYMQEEAPPGLSPVEKVLDVLGRLARFARERPGEMRVLCLPQPSREDDSLADAVARVNKSMAAGERRTAALIEAARRRGETQPLSARDAAAFLWSAWKGMLTLGPRAERAAAGRDRELRALIETGLRIVVGGLASERARETDETVRAIIESAPTPVSAGDEHSERPLELRRAAVANELREEFPEIGLWTAELPYVAGATPEAVRRRLAGSSAKLTAAAAIGAREESTPWAYRVFARRVGVDPAEAGNPVEAAALHRGGGDDPEPAGPPGDALLIAVAETGVPVLAFDADELDGEIWLRPARAGERVADGPEIPAGRPVLADTVRVLATPFGAGDVSAAVGPATARVALAALQVKGVPDVGVEQALWTVVEILREPE